MSIGLRRGIVLVLSILVSISLVAYSNESVSIYSHALDRASDMAEAAAAEIDSQLAAVVPVHQALTRSLGELPRNREALESHLCQVLGEHPILFGVGAAFHPFRFGEETRLFAPYCRQRDGSAEAISLPYDYTLERAAEAGPDGEHKAINTWYHSAVRTGRDTWQEPHYGNASQTWIVNITGPFFDDGEDRDPLGVVFTTLSLAEFRQLMADIDLGETGYSFLVSAEGRFIVHPKESYLGSTLLAVGEERGDDDLREISEAARLGRSGYLDHSDELTGKRSWMFYQPVPTTGWSLVTVVDQDEVVGAQIDELRALRPWIVLQGVLAAIAMAWFVFGGPRPAGSRSHSYMAAATTAIAVFGSILLVELGSTSDQGQGDGIVEVGSHEGLSHYLSDYEQSVAHLGRGEAIHLPTGLFVQSLDFVGSNDVHLTGFLWQRYRTEQLQELRPGFLFPEAVASKVQPAYWRQEGEEQVIGWYFEATLRQSFDYGRYPFDSKKIWIRIWHRDFYENVISVPDLGSYGLTHPSAKPGLEEDLVVAGWLVEQSFFGLRRNSYSTDFGIGDYVGQDGFPELYFNVLTRRESGGALIVHFVLLIVVAIMIFAMLISITSKEEENRWIGFSFSSLMGGASSLFFVLILSHIQLRQEVPENLCYLEWFYFLMYFAILATTVFGYRVAAPNRFGPISAAGIRAPKLLFWPALAGFAFWVSFHHFG